MRVRLIIDRVVLDGFDPRTLDGRILEDRLRSALDAELQRRVSLGERHPATLPEARSTRRERTQLALGAHPKTASVGVALGGAVVGQVWSGGNAGGRG